MSTAIAAPSAAPDAVPSTYGSASGLRSRPWNVAPATARPGPDDHRREDPRQAQVPDDRLGRRRPGPIDVEAEQPLGEDAERVAGRDRDRAEPDAEHERDGEGDEPPDPEEDRATTGAPDQATAGRRDASAPSVVMVATLGYGAADAAGEGDSADDGAPGMSASGWIASGEQPEAVDETRAGPRDDDVVDRPDLRRP